MFHALDRTRLDLDLRILSRNDACSLNRLEKQDGIETSKQYLFGRKHGASIMSHVISMRGGTISSSFSSGGITEYINLRVYRDQHLSGSQSCVTRRLPMRDRSRFAISDPVHANIVLRSNKGLAFTFTASKEKEGKIVFEEFLRHARKSHI